ncbi:hypothetical protein [Phyllobacterium sp. YR620]|uniref:hypothetical protein n=1 Tax=Phyllobacterium sp. YR620 TaxID=1881066 RepID=UPI0011143AE2|nr:hypothetical protein [Phyllobacterium sp. YR620]
MKYKLEAKSAAVVRDFFENGPVYRFCSGGYRAMMLRHTKENGDIANWMTCSICLFGALAVAAIILAI